MFLILGSPQCKYCLESKKLLDEAGIHYTYNDLTLEFGDNWRLIFVLLKDILGPQKTIPIVFQSKDVGDREPTLPSVRADYTPEFLLKDWNLVGTFFDLQEVVEEMKEEMKEGTKEKEGEELTIDGDY